MKRLLKLFFIRISQLLVLPCAAICWAEGSLCDHSEAFFLFWSHLFSILPGTPGLFIRRAFYTLTLERCSPECYIGFGAIFTHRATIVEKNAYVGLYALIGSAHLGERCLIGSRASLLSGGYLHSRREDGSWAPFDPSQMIQIKIGRDAWIGEGAVVMADVGDGSMVAAGSVVSSNIKANIVVAGNPARFVRNL
ncbi:DapH/DapD/GlmU-related protein [Desulforhabdus sp. TSK]|uniref:acyltransferase n=1 Tax=Desulforhabdus sp. TSK TaxID=2925014 RepID=UPI001FC8DA13|nr:acyltransferase [Desulforhabdus sp. TSK]GKT07864.1 transferase [Desulforhabdus sp. TSK]